MKKIKVKTFLVNVIVHQTLIVGDYLIHSDIMEGKNFADVEKKIIEKYKKSRIDILQICAYRDEE